VTLERLERRRGDTWQGIWLAPLIAIVAQAFLLGVLVDENIGWLARAAVLVAAVATSLSAIWSVLRAHAREVQYSEAIAALDPDEPDIRPAALSRPQRRRTKEPAAEESEAAAEAATTVDATPASEGETAVLDATPPPPTSPGRADKDDESEGWVSRWDRHLVWWASGETHAKTYMAWTATLALFLLADVAVYLSAV
jgi:hypothetical protein